MILTILSSQFRSFLLFLKRYVPTNRRTDTLLQRCEDASKKRLCTFIESFRNRDLSTLNSVALLHVTTSLESRPTQKLQTHIVPDAKRLYSSFSIDPNMKVAQFYTRLQMKTEAHFVTLENSSSFVTDPTIKSNPQSSNENSNLCPQLHVL